MKKDKSILNNKQRLKDIISYQKNTISSNTIINKKTGTITIFAFDKGQSLSTHTAPFDAMVYIIDGKVEITISKKSYILNKGETIIMPANEPHSLKALNKFKMLLIMIKN